MNPEKRRLIFALITIAMVVTFNVTGALTGAGWKLATGSTAFTLLVMLAWQARTRDPVFGRWLLIGLVGGWIEITTDAWLVANTQTLLYPPGEPLVWDSPLYMPFAWMIVLAQTGIIATWLGQRLPLAAAMLITGLIGGISIPLYELLAHYANYWTYTRTPMILHAPFYIIVSEFLLTLPLPWIGRLALRRPWPYSLALGALVGVLMFPAVLIAWWLVGPCEGAIVQFSCTG